MGRTLGTGSSIAFAAAVACLLVAAFAQFAEAHHPGDGTIGAKELRHQAPLLGEIENAADGLIRVDIDGGPDLFTHGADTRKELAAGEVGGFSPGSPERPLSCSEDGYFQHILYANITGTPDESSERAEDLRGAMRRTNYILNQDSLESGGPTADYKVLCEAGGEIQVDAFTASGTSYSEVVASARAAGFDDRNADYTIFLDGSGSVGYCGVGSYYSDERSGAENYNNLGGGYAITFEGCWFGSALMHENGHNQGAVQYNAPSSTGDGGHCNDERDVMCYSPDGGDLNQEGTVLNCSDRTYFDCGFDTYFDSAPEPGEYLKSNWNIGSSVNRFIEFGAEPEPEPDPEPENVAPTSSFSANCELGSCVFGDKSEDPDGSIVSYGWAFGDGTVSQGQSPAHVFALTGSYEVSLTVVDDDGATDTSTQQLSVEVPIRPEDDPGPVGPGDDLGPVQPTDPNGGSTPAPSTWDAGEIEVRALGRGKVSRAQSASEGDLIAYRFRVPKRSRKIVVTLRGSGGDFDLFLRRGKAATPSDFDCASTGAGSRATCKIKRPRKGRWFATVHGAAVDADASFRIGVTVQQRRR